MHGSLEKTLVVWEINKRQDFTTIWIDEEFKPWRKQCTFNFLQKPLEKAWTDIYLSIYLSHFTHIHTQTQIHTHAYVCVCLCCARVYVCIFYFVHVYERMDRERWRNLFYFVFIYYYFFLNLASFFPLP